MIIDMEGLRGLPAHEEAQSQLATRLQELETEAAGRPFDDAQRAEFDEIVEQRAVIGEVIKELQIREAAVAEAVSNERSIEATAVPMPHVPNVNKVPTDAEIHDLAGYRQRVRGVEELAGAYRDGALRIAEKAHLPTALNQEDAREHLVQIINKHATEDYGWASRRIIGTDTAQYKEAWAHYVSGGYGTVPTKLQAALLTYTDASGGYAIPFTIDPTFILTTDGAVNPIRSMARVETITTKSWSPITTGGVTAAYALETAAASDAAPSDVASPSITPIRAHVLVGFSAEYSEDYGPAAIQAEVGALIRDAKDVLEADKFIMGSGTNEPTGIVAGIIAAAGTNIVTSATVNTFALVDVDALEGVLGDRFITDAQFLAARKIYQLIRGFSTAGQPANSIYDAMSGTLRGYPAKVSQAMDKVTTTGAEPLLFGSFRQFVVVDRLGLSTEFVPMLFDTNGAPLGRRGIYARWRNDTGIVVQNAFRLLRIG